MTEEYFNEYLKLDQCAQEIITQEINFKKKRHVKSKKEQRQNGKKQRNGLKMKKGKTQQ